MQAVAVFSHERAVRLVDHPEPRISEPDEVKVRVLDVGICGTDREIAAFEYGEPPAGSTLMAMPQAPTIFPATAGGIFITCVASRLTSPSETGAAVPPGNIHSSHAVVGAIVGCSCRIFTRM